jgi:cytidine deaminase
MAEHDPDDVKLLTLARSARARNGTEEGAAVRDSTGRTYVATTVALPSLALSAVAAAVAAAVSSGATALEAVALVSGSEASAADLQLSREIAGPQSTFLVADKSGSVVAVHPLA